MSDATRGPWQLERDPGNNDFAVLTGIGWGAFATIVIHMEDDEDDKPEGLANAHLLHAAEDMLHALEMVRDADNDCIADGHAQIPPIPRGVIDRAIAKALSTEPIEPEE